VKGFRSFVKRFLLRGGNGLGHRICSLADTDEDGDVHGQENTAFTSTANGSDYWTDMVYDDFCRIVATFRSGYPTDRPRSGSSTIAPAWTARVHFLVGGGGGMHRSHRATGTQRPDSEGQRGGSVAFTSCHSPWRWKISTPESTPSGFTDLAEPRSVSRSRQGAVVEITWRRWRRSYCAELVRRLNHNRSRRLDDRWSRVVA
jgi:hypothetical protein